MQLQDKWTKKNNKEVTFKNCSPFSHYISKINNPQTGYGKNLDVAMRIYNLLEYGDDYAEASRGLW